ncbi:hypothetical protein MKP05_20740 [Halomonas sp. EGI 63088]|uniref:Uncharacterized protein n=1 Tax=Halomonas flagellata TaxID=2920385 RepID=A0ABS9S0F2_9GAMM|nr:hypothetical protein [Halomonas flagellata]MCH4565529.1 hypothetical protein [Halomonas flagellata]
MARSLVNFRGPLLRLLSECGHRVVTAAHSDAATDAVSRELASLSIPFEALAIGRGGLNPLEDWRTAWAIRALIERQQPEAVIAYRQVSDIQRPGDSGGDGHRAADYHQGFAW